MEIHGIRIDWMKFSDIIDLINNNKTEKKGSFLATLDVLGLDLTTRNKDYFEALKQASMVFLDGAGVILIAKIMKKLPPPRFPGADLFLKLCSMASKNNFRIFLYGSKPEVLIRLERELRKKFPEIIICGTLDGYSVSAEDAPAIIKNCNPDILFVALGIPHQECFINKEILPINIPLSMGVGGSFDVHSGTLKRAPRFLQKLGLEWLFRLIQQPKRVFKIIRIPIFLIKTYISEYFRQD